MTLERGGWYMSPDEREQLAIWLSQFRGYELILELKLSELDAVGVTYGATHRRLHFVQHSVSVPVYPRQHFVDILHAGGVRGDLAPGDWRAVSVLDLAEALLSLAGFTMIYPPHITARIDRYKSCMAALRDEAWTASKLDPTDTGLRA